MRRQLPMCFASLIVLLLTHSILMADAVDVHPGVHLFVDDFLIQSVSNVTRRPTVLNREDLSARPILTSTEHHTFQPFFSVIRDPGSGRFRLWYGIPTEDLNTVRSRIAYTESTDGIHWTNRIRILDVGPVQFGASVIDEGAEFNNPPQRFKVAWYFEKGLKIATSRDGFVWQPLSNDVLIQHNHDINGIFWDSIRQRYTAILSFHTTGDAWKGNRRITKQSVSSDLLRWSEPRTILSPDAADPGETQFYAMDGFLRRGDLFIGMVKVLRDDLKADNPPQPPDAYGIGFTTIAFTRNGQDWTRECSAFLDRNPIPGSWDHAHAWIDEQVLVGDEVYFYYAGYKSGHKVNRFQERQIGLIKMKRDRYVGREAIGLGTLRTPPLNLAGKKLLLNANAAHGEIKVRALDSNGKPITGFQFETCTAVHDDAVKIPLRWNTAEKLPKQVTLEFQIKDAVLYGFELE